MTFPDLHVGARAIRPGTSSDADREHFNSSRQRQHLRKRQRPRARGKQGKRGMSHALASRRPTRCRFASARGAQEQITPHPQERIARCAGQSASTAPLHLSGAAALRWAAVRATDRTGLFVLDWTTRRTRKKGRNRPRFPPCQKSQNSSSMPPWTVWTTRAARCAGKML